MKRKWLAIGIILLFVGVTIVPAIAQDTEKSIPTSRGNTIYVDDDNIEGPWDGTLEYPFQRILDAVNIVSDGDTIYVFHGYYNESLDFDFTDPITFNLTGEDKNTTFINGTIEASYCPLTIIVTNFTLYSVDLGLGINHYNTIKDCRIGAGGVFLVSSYTRIINNIFMDSSLLIHGGRGDTIIGNSFSSKGIAKDEPDYDYMWKWDTHFIENNTIKGRPIRYYINKTNVVVPEDTGQLYLVNCSNFSVQNLTISDLEIGITAYHSPYTTISNCSISNESSSGGIYYAETGISLLHSDYSTIKNTTVYNFSYGIYCERSEAPTITDCVIQNNYYGILILGGTSAFISRCIIMNNQIAIESYVGLNTVEFCAITQNNISIYIEESSKNIIKNNNIFDNIHEPYFLNSYFTKWIRNYWGRPISGPKVIHGRIVYYPYRLPTIDIRWINFDWFPALRPYNI